MKKKGISPLIAYVILVGFAVGLGAIFTTWYMNTSQDTREQYFKEIETGIQCEDVKLNVGFNYDSCKVEVFNTGIQVWKKVAISGSYLDSGGARQKIDEDIDGPINPKESRETNALFTAEVTDLEVYVNAYVQLDKKTVSCVNDRVYKPTKSFAC
ncbi:hypothetical protein HY643_00720 [Candidatus Woesearchaeota archaeon]|nr:hypothetical protein [Candidatus Woesearchaeota archaeon]